MAKVKDAFAGKKANIGYVVAGYPSVEATKEFLLNLDGSCLDLLELGIPYSDPLADGKLIAQASFETAQSGVNTDVVFDMLEGCKAKVTKPLVFLVYYNIIFAYGVDKFLKRSVEAGVSGFIVPDLPCEECEEFALKCKELNLSLIPLISVTSGGRADGILKFGSRARALSKFKAASDDNFADEIYAANARRKVALGADRKRALFKWRLNQKRTRELNL